MLTLQTERNCDAELPNGARPDDSSAQERMTVDKSRSNPVLRHAAVAGWLGAGVLGGTILGLSIIEYEFMRSLGWHPISAPARDWPSGLALGPYGWAMIGAFLASGAAMLVFARGLRLALEPHGERVSALVGMLLSGSGVALLLLASPTDPTISTITPTLHGMLHDAAFVVLGLTFFPGLICSALAARRDPGAKWFALPTLIVAGLSVPAFVLKGFWFYLFLIAALGWIGIVATQLWRLSQQSAVRPR